MQIFGQRYNYTPQRKLTWWQRLLAVPQYPVHTSGPTQAVLRRQSAPIAHRIIHGHKVVTPTLHRDGTAVPTVLVGVKDASHVRHLPHLLPGPGVPAQPGHLLHLGLQLRVRVRVQVRVQFPPWTWLTAAVVALALDVDELVVVEVVLRVSVGAGVLDPLLSDATLQLTQETKKQIQS